MAPLSISAGSSNEGRGVEKRIKDLIKLFEEVGEQNAPIIHRKTMNYKNIAESSLTRVSQLINPHLQTKSPVKVPSVCESTDNELESCVSVRSIVCNFQKLNEAQTSGVSKSITVKKTRLWPTKTESKPAAPPQFIQKSSQSIVVPAKVPAPVVADSAEDLKKFSDIPPYQEPVQQPPPVVPTQEQEILPILPQQIQPPKDESKDESDDETVSSSLDDDEFDIPRGDGVTPLPDSYRVCGSSGSGRLELILPPPPKRSCLKRRSSGSKKPHVKFNDEADVAETYNQLEYTRAVEDLDVIGATAESEFEKVFERMKQVKFSVHKEPNEKLGLQVYGVSIRPQSTKNNMAIYVKAVTPGSLCDKAGVVHTDDLIIDINGVNMIGVDVSKVTDTIRSSGSDIHFTVGRDTDNAKI